MQCIQCGNVITSYAYSEGQIVGESLPDGSRVYHLSSWDLGAPYR